MITFRLGEGVKGETIRGDLAALSGALNYARKRNRLREVPFIPGVDAALRSGPKELEYSMEQVAGLLEAAWRLQERHHVHLFTLISLSTHGRTEAILELEAPQVRDGIIRSEEHTSELQSLMRISYAVFCLKKKITPIT